jgi:hypothetical protein
MFVVVQFPFTDARPFLEVDTHRLGPSLWDLPRPNSDFIRSFGIFKRRLRGGIRDWSGEETFCRASRALRIEPPFTQVEVLDGSTKIVNSSCIFRRFFVNSYGNPRFELGILYRSYKDASRNGKRKRLRLGQQGLANIIRSTLELPVSVPFDGGIHSRKLIHASSFLAKHYLQSSTRYQNGSLPHTENWWVRSEEPVLLIEYKFNELDDIPEGQPVRSPTLLNAKIQLSYLWIQIEGKEVGTWLLGYQPATVDKKVLRQLRINLLKLHSERENLKEIFRLIIRDKINVQAGSKASDNLQNYLKKATRLLSKETYHGLPQSEIMRAATQARDLINQGEKETLIDKMSGIRLNILRNLKEFTSSPNHSASIENELVKAVHQIDRVDGDLNITIVHKAEGPGIMNVDKSQNIDFSGISGNVNIGGDVNQTAAKTIQNAFNKANEVSSTKPELQAKLQELAQAVAEMSGQLPEGVQQRVAQDLQTLTEQATSDNPERKWYELSAKGLIEAAKAVGEVAAPVVKATEAVLSLLV